MRRYFFSYLLEDKEYTRMLAYLPPKDLGNVLLGKYYLSNLQHIIVPITRDNLFLVKETLIEAVLEEIKRINNEDKETTDTA